MGLHKKLIGPDRHSINHPPHTPPPNSPPNFFIFISTLSRHFIEHLPIAPAQKSNSTVDNDHVRHHPDLIRRRNLHQLGVHLTRQGAHQIRPRLPPTVACDVRLPLHRSPQVSGRDPIENPLQRRLLPRQLRYYRPPHPLP